MSKLFRYSFTVEYRPGHLNIVADALSHRGDSADSATNFALSRPTFSLFEELRQVISSPDLRTLCSKVQSGELRAPWSFIDGLLLHGEKVYVSEASPSLQAILSTAHVGHEGFRKHFIVCDQIFMSLMREKKYRILCELV